MSSRKLHFAIVRCAGRLRLLLALVAGCHTDMYDQPRYEPMEKSDFFADGRTSRPTVAGTVARGDLRDDEKLYTGRESGQLVDGAAV